MRIGAKEGGEALLTQIMFELKRCSETMYAFQACISNGESGRRSVDVGSAIKNLVRMREC